MFSSFFIWLLFSFPELSPLERVLRMVLEFLHDFSDIDSTSAFVLTSSFDINWLNLVSLYYTSMFDLNVVFELTQLYMNVSDLTLPF